ncbi:multiple sugar transport system permease protein [Microbacterium natoriense]|uniref:Multiple sugar transport system permease protein n=1 Tax=Microbacterium natoriense TaxID=284570 RepID=A0AAW8EUI4_9MICO|nr:sugar ABC transporter permease [Microbacterium natoriense]MDQ0646524.1 multiple sugar transport system permease protein [Microbacterium natoriense]
MTEVPTAAQRRRTRPLGSRVASWVRGGGITTFLFFVPLLFTFGYFAWWPILRSLVMALQKTNLVTEPTWVGLNNFERVLADPLLGTAVLNTIWFATLALLIGFPVPILLATFMAELRRTRQVASVLVYLPVIIPPVVSVLLWKQFYDPSPDGLFNAIFGIFGAGPLPWLQNGDSAMPSIVLQATWAGFGQSTIIYLAALMSIQSELYEAAEMDGAKVLRRFWHITLPQMRSIMLLMLLLQIIGTMQVFTEPFVMTGGGPVNRTTTVLMLIYNYAFLQGDYGKATALSLLLAVVLTAVSAIYLRLTRSWSKS